MFYAYNVSSHYASPLRTRLTWQTEITAPSGASLPPGSLNLYQYPFVAFGENAAIELDGEQLAVRPVTVVTASRSSPMRGVGRGAWGVGMWELGRGALGGWGDGAGESAA